MLGARIAALRKEAGMSQAELASRLKISPSAVGMYEQGRREPSVDILVAMAGIFQVSTDYLLLGRPAGAEEVQTVERLLLRRIAAAEQRLGESRERSFSREELAMLFAAMLTD